MMPENIVKVEKKDHIARITLNRPESGNSIDLQMTQELNDICQDVNQDQDIYVVTFTGAGESFCTGAGPEVSGQFAGKGAPFLTNAAAALASVECPVIAVINGDALGEGLELALACDIRLAADNARFGFPQLASGLIPGSGGTQRLPRLVGKGKALEMILTAEIIGANEAWEIGLVSKTVPGTELAAEAEALANKVAGQAPISLRYCKEAVNKGMDITLEQGLRLEADLYLLLHTTVDRTEGITAFLEKRKPEFKGN